MANYSIINGQDVSGGGTLKTLKQKEFLTNNADLVNGDNQQTINDKVASFIQVTKSFIDPENLSYKGVFDSLVILQSNIASPDLGDYAFVRDVSTIYFCGTLGSWNLSLNDSLDSSILTLKGGVPVDGDTLKKLNDKILTLQAYVNYSFYVDGGVIFFDNSTNIINKDSDLLICTKSGTVGAFTFTKGYIYKVNANNSTPDETNLVEFVSLANFKQAILSRDFSDNSGVVYKGGTYQLNADSSGIEQLAVKTETKILNISVNSTINSGLYVINENNIYKNTLNIINITNNNVNNVLQLPDFSTNISDARLRIVLLANQSQLTVRVGATGEQIIIYPSSTAGVYADGHYVNDVSGGYFSFL